MAADSDAGVTVRLLSKGPPAVSRRTSAGSVYLTRTSPTATLKAGDARRIAATSRWLVIEDDAPTCVGAGGECSRTVDEPGAYCWQHDDGGSDK